MNNLNHSVSRSLAEQMAELVKRSHESEKDYKNLQFLINQSQLSLGEKMTLLQSLDKKFSR